MRQAVSARWDLGSARLEIFSSQSYLILQVQSFRAASGIAALLSDFLCMLTPLPCNESFSYFLKGDFGTTANESLRDAFAIRVIGEIRVLTICEICSYLWNLRVAERQILIFSPYLLWKAVNMLLFEEYPVCFIVSFIKKY